MKLKPGKTPYIFSKEKFSYVPKKFFIYQEAETPKKFYIFQEVTFRA